MGASELVDVREVAYDDPLAASLIEEVQEEYVVRYGGRDGTPVTRDEFAPPTGAFLIAVVDDAAVACGGLRRHAPDAAELKRMYVRASHRGRGLGRALLAALEARAISLGYRRVVLETGMRQPEAIALYRSSGYAPIPGFGHYRDSPGNRCFGKDVLGSS